MAFSWSEHCCGNREDEKRIYKKQDPSQQHQTVDPGHLVFSPLKNEFISEPRACKFKRVLKRPYFCDWRPFGLRAGHFTTAESANKPALTSTTLKCVSIDQYSCESKGQMRTVLRR